MEKIRWKKSEGAAYLNSADVWNGNTKKYQYVVVRDDISTNFGEGKHISIKKVDIKKLKKDALRASIDAMEPDYGEKLSILKKLGKWNRVGLEIFPSIKNVVDDSNLYHIWEIESMRKFPFPTYLAFTVPNSTEYQTVSVGKIQGKYVIRTLKNDMGTITYLYLKSTGKEFSWSEKQALKDKIVGENITAVELICDYIISGVARETCLICLPAQYELKFGLHLKKS